MSSRHFRLIAAVAAIAAVIPLPLAAEMRLVADKFLGFTPTAVAVDPVARKAFLLRHDHFDSFPRIKTVDLDTLVLGEIAVVSFPYQMVVDASRGLLYVTHQSPTSGEGMLSAVDTREGRVVGFKLFAAYPGAIVADLARRELYLASEWANSIWVVDADRVDVAQEIPLGEGFAAAGLGVDRRRDRIVVGNWLGSPIGVVDRSTRTLIARNAVSDESWLFDGGSESVVVDERRGLAYLMHTSGELSVLRAPDFRPAVELADAWGVHYHSEQAALSLAWQSLYQVGHEWFGDGRRTTYALRSVDGGSGSKRIAALAGDDGFWARTLVVDDDGGDVYVTAGQSSQTLLRIDPATLQVRETLATAGVVGELSFRDPVTGRIYIAGSQRLLAVEVKGAKTGTRIATGFHQDVFDHFFVTADPVERRLIDDGRYGSGWTVSDDLFRVWSEPVAGSVPVCRFLSARLAPKSSHVYTPHANECEVLQNDGAWQFEGIAFHVALPDAAGACPVGTEPLYRLYNGGKGGAPNHRYTTSTHTAAAMTANGWSAEGVGPDRVFACTPALR